MTPMDKITDEESTRLSRFFDDTLLTIGASDIGIPADATLPFVGLVRSLSSMKAGLRESLARVAAPSPGVGGLVVPEDAKKMAGPFFAPPGTWLLPLETKSEINLRDWKERSKRTKKTLKITCKALGQNLQFLAVFANHFHMGGKLKIKFTRLGGRRMDRSNLPTAMKAVEDAFALVMACDDGDPRWLSEFEQEPESPLAGVRIQMEIVK